MANAKILEQKSQVVSEIKDKFANAKSVVVFDYRGLTVAEVTELRKQLKDAGVNTLIGLIASNDDAQRFYRSLEKSLIRDEGIWIDL